MIFVSEWDDRRRKLLVDGGGEVDVGRSLDEGEGAGAAYHHPSRRLQLHRGKNFGKQHHKIYLSYFYCYFES